MKGFTIELRNEADKETLTKLYTENLLSTMLVILKEFKTLSDTEIIIKIKKEYKK